MIQERDSWCPRGLDPRNKIPTKEHSLGGLSKRGPSLDNYPSCLSKTEAAWRQYSGPRLQNILHQRLSLVFSELFIKNPLLCDSHLGDHNLEDIFLNKSLVHK